MGDHELRLGSGMGGQPLAAVLCANTQCRSPAPTKVCKDCRLVGYCSRECQKQHWQLHKLLCRSELMKQDMITPSWLTEGRLPSWLRLADDHVVLQEPLWGNVPAYGLLGSFSSSSTSSCPITSLPHLQLCFAASGDLRNVIETVCQLPQGFHGSVTVHVNDINPKVVVRNYLMLELLRIHGDEAIDAVIALWYSLALTPAQLQAAMAVAEQVQDWPARGKYHYSSSSFDGPSGPDCLVAKLHKKSLRVLKSLCDNDMPLSQAKSSRRKMMEGRPYLVERRMGCLRPSHRVAWNHFRQTGVMLPLTIDLDKHMINQANRFLLLPSVGWALGDGAGDPLNGWDKKQMLAYGMHRGVPPMDLYGCLFFYVRDKLHTFLLKWKQYNVTFILTDMAATELARELRSRSPVPKFQRIDTSNIADEDYDGVKRVLNDWGPLLDKSSTPVESILITYFMNWGILYNSMKPAQNFVDPGGVTPADLGKGWGFGGEEMTKMMRSMALQGELDWYRCFHDFSSTFTEYLHMQGAQRAAQEVGLRQRPQHALVPHRLFVRVRAGRNATPADFFSSPDDLYFASALEAALTLLERFVEWGPSERERGKTSEEKQASQFEVD